MIELVRGDGNCFYRASKCCEPRVIEVKCPYTGRDLMPQSAFLSASVGGILTAEGMYKLKSSHSYYFQVQTQMLVSGLKKCDFVTYTSKGIYVIEVDFDEQFLQDVLTKVSLFYQKYIIPSLLLQLSQGCAPLKPVIQQTIPKPVVEKIKEHTLRKQQVQQKKLIKAHFTTKKVKILKLLHQLCKQNHYSIKHLSTVLKN